MLFFCQIVGGLFFLDALFGLLFFSTVFFSFFFSFLLLFVCFFSCFFLRSSKSAAPQFFMVVFHIFRLFFVGRGFSWRLFLLFFFHSLWRFDDFYCLYLIWHSMGSAQCVIYVRHQISESTICTVVGTFLILKAINYFLCFCFVFIR